MHSPYWLREVSLSVSYVGTSGNPSNSCVNITISCLVETNENSYEIYICYHGEQDRLAFVEPVYCHLNKIGVRAFYDKESVNWGEFIPAAVGAALRACDRVLLVVSDSLLKMGSPLMELSALLEQQREAARQTVIYPVLLGDIDEARFHREIPLLRAVQPHVSMATPEGIDKICDYIKRVCSKPIPVLGYRSLDGHNDDKSGQGNLRLLAPDFTGRNDLVNEIVDHFTNKEGCTIFGLGGTPGVGKSMVAIAVGSELQKQKWRTVYADVRDLKSPAVAAEKLIEALLDKANVGGGLLGLGNALKNLGKQNKFLIVLDNCDWLLENNCQNPTHRHVSPLHSLLDTITQHYHDLKALFTASHQVVSSHMPITYNEVPPLTTEDAAAYLTKRCPEFDLRRKSFPKWPETLAKLCGGFPVALNFISSIIQTTRLSPNSIIHYLSTKGVCKLQKQFSCRIPFEHFNCFSAAFNHLEWDRQRSSVACLTVFPGSFTMDAASAVLQLQRSKVQREVMHPLLERCLLQRIVAGHRYYMYSVVREYLYELGREQYRDKIHQARRSFTDYYKQLLGSVSSQFWKDPSTALEIFDNEWHNFELIINCHDDFSYNSTQFLPTILDALPLLKTRLPSTVLLKLCQSYIKLSCPQTIRAQLLLETAERLIEEGSVERALPLIEDAKKLVQDCDGHVDGSDNSSFQATYYKAMGDALIAQDKPVEAAFFLSKSWKLHESIGSAHYQSITVLTVLGQSFADLGQTGKAMDCYAKANQICSLRLGGHDRDKPYGSFARGIHPYKVSVLKQMGETESSRGDQKKALMHMDKAIKILSQLRSCDLLLAPILYEKGVTQLLDDQQAEAMQTIEQSFELTTQVNGCDLLHFFIAAMLGKLKYNEGCFGAAAELLREAVQTATHVGYSGDMFVEAWAFLCISQKQLGKTIDSSVSYSSFSDALRKCDAQQCQQNPAIRILSDSSQFRMPTNGEATVCSDFDPPRATFCCCRYSDFTRWHHLTKANSPLCLKATGSPVGRLVRSPSASLTPMTESLLYGIEYTPDDNDVYQRRLNSVSSKPTTPLSVAGDMRPVHGKSISAMFGRVLQMEHQSKTLPRPRGHVRYNSATKIDQNHSGSPVPSLVHRFLSWNSQPSHHSWSSDSVGFEDSGQFSDGFDSAGESSEVVQHNSPKPTCHHGHRRLSADGRQRQGQMQRSKAMSEPKWFRTEGDTSDCTISCKELDFVDDHFAADINDEDMI